MDCKMSGNMTHDKLTGKVTLLSSIEEWEEAIIDINYHIKEKTEINLGLIFIRY